MLSCIITLMLKIKLDRSVRIYDIVSEADGTYYHLKVDNTKYGKELLKFLKDILAKCNFSVKNLAL